MKITIEGLEGQLEMGQLIAGLAKKLGCQTELITLDRAGDVAGHPIDTDSASTKALKGKLKARMPLGVIVIVKQSKSGRSRS